MNSFFDKITNSFSSNATKKFLHEILLSNYELQPKYPPLQLRKIISNQSGRLLFIKQMSTVSELIKNPSANKNQKDYEMLKILKKMTVFHHLIVYYNQHSEMIEQINLDNLLSSGSHNEWFLNNILKPYSCFIKKFCLGIQMFQKLKSMPYGSKQNIFESMCFAVNNLKVLFNVISKLPALGRYFRQGHQTNIDYFVLMMSYHAQQIYQGFRACITQIISFSKDHLPKKQDQIFMKQILQTDLPWINEQMKKLFLDKYFFPYGKGYGIKLYKIQQQNQYQSQIINGILNDHEHTERRRQLKILEQTLFPSHSLNFSHEQLEKSFSFSLSKIKSSKQKAEINNPQKDIDAKNLNNSVMGIEKQFKIRKVFTQKKKRFQQEVVEQEVEQV